MTRGLNAGTRLGFEVGTGDPVSIPHKHLAICGQTQEAGKTTTLEALLSGSGARAISFITKRGEGAFTNARKVSPYFREQADWQYVAAILEASRGEKLKLERAFIIRASKGAHTLADVQRNVRALLDNPKLRGMAADMYLCLDAYLEVVVPQIARVKWATTVELAEGSINVMDLGGLPLEMQHLVIRSTISWVLDHAQDTVVVIPEAWKFIPQGRGTPVKLAAEAFIRQGAALGNFLWLDSQDLGGIEKAILRSVAVWLIGVQREANEIKRTLDNIPAGTAKPKAADIAQLELGQFYACWGRHVVKTYVQPAWMDDEEARGHALGNQMTKGGRRGEHSRRTDDRVPPSSTFSTKQGGTEMCEKHQQLERELANEREIARDLTRELEDVKTLSAERMKALAEKNDQLAVLGLLRRGLEALWPGAATSGRAAAPVDEEALVARVLARIPSNGHVVNVTPPEALRLQVQKDVAARLVQQARHDLPPAAKKLLKVHIAIEKRISQRQAAERAGVGWGGGVQEAYKALNDASLIDAHPKGGTKANVRERVVALLEDLGAQADVVEQVYQSVLYELATEGA